jgi:hypothetical protein
VRWVVKEVTERVRRLLRRMHDYAACFKTSPRGELTDSGARVLADMARYCGAYDTTVKVSPISRSIDPLASAVAEGRRQAYLYLLKNIRLDPEAILTTMEDAEK